MMSSSHIGTNSTASTTPAIGLPGYHRRPQNELVSGLIVLLLIAAWIVSGGL